MTTTMLGLSCGNPGGSVEILVIEALRAAAAAGAATELVRLDDLRLDGGPEDDAEWFWERLIGCDAWIVGAPIISRTVPGRLKLLGDRLLGPNADAAIIEGLLEVRRHGGEPAVPFRVDERVLRPRVAGFIACGGALTTQWKALALPVMHTLTFSMSTSVVDQIVVEGAGTPRSAVLDAAAIARAAELGRHVASQAGRPLGEAEYLGPPGACPLCHLDVVVLRGTSLECATCGARGVLGDEGVAWTDLESSVISMEERRAHYREIVDTARFHAARRDEVAQLAAQYEGFPVTRPPR
ncbi:NAD(P)H-dependent oxidoreductase [Demequina capsici]|uniref:NAD(P)H-dependent oxidoreductase n=1 Tax=Demequina capsici TaxID=3075620 RepID=A0AA96FFL9_9MICO|nr:NAD(P)H-dependent oxidoreductase [Demequina sp. PMTSA13]WNM28537.1 NAD(P)H-dependent oxidoreductase [Demequina sp. PMTSA13]